MAEKPIRQAWNSESRERPTRDQKGFFGSVVQEIVQYRTTPHDSQYSAYDGYPEVQADISNAGYEHDPFAVDRPE